MSDSPGEHPAWPRDWARWLSDPHWRRNVGDALAARDLGGLLARCEVWMGLEIHLRLATGRKLFCAAKEGSAGWVDLGWPGALPSLDPKAVELSVGLGRALGARISERIGFERKRYAYPDLSKGYQTTQKAFCSWFGGAVLWEGGSMRIDRAQIEEDAAKVGRAPGGFEMDYARAGSPLLEVVGEACLMEPEAAARASKALWREAVHCGASQGLIQEGHFKTDINISIRPRGAGSMGERVEVKGVGSFDFCELAGLDAMWMLASEILGAAPGGMRTLGFDEASKSCSEMRRKGSEAEYKFLPDGDLPMSAQPIPPGEPPASWRSTCLAWTAALDGSAPTRALLDDPRRTKALANAGDGALEDALAMGPAQATSLIHSFFGKAKEGSAGSGPALAWALGMARGGAKRASVVEAALRGLGAGGFDPEAARATLEESAKAGEGGSAFFEGAWLALASSDPKAAEALAQAKAGKARALGYAAGAMGRELAARSVAFDRQELSEWLAAKAAGAGEGESIQGERA